MSDAVPDDRWQKVLQSLSRGHYRSSGAWRRFFDGSVFSSTRFASTSLLEYVASARAIHYDRTRALACLRARGPIVMFGDSRLRFIYAALVALIGGADQAEQLGYRRCPYDTAFARLTGQFSYAKCVAHYSGYGLNWTQGTRDDGRIIEYVADRQDAEHARIVYGVSRYARNPIPTASLPRGGILFATSGAWSASLQFGMKAAESAEDVPDTEADLIRFAAQLSRRARPGARKVWMGYPHCVRRDQSAPFPPTIYRSDALRKLLGHGGWAVYDASSVTSAFSNRSGGRAWHRDMVPASSLRSAVKLDQCELFHTFDSLTDLEVQILLNAVCRDG